MTIFDHVTNLLTISAVKPQNVDEFGYLKTGNFRPERPKNQNSDKIELKNPKFTLKPTFWQFFDLVSKLLLPENWTFLT